MINVWLSLFSRQRQSTIQATLFTKSLVVPLSKLKSTIYMQTFNLAKHLITWHASNYAILLEATLYHTLVVFRKYLAQRVQNLHKKSF